MGMIFSKNDIYLEIPHLFNKLEKILKMKQYDKAQKIIDLITNSLTAKENEGIYRSLILDLYWNELNKIVKLHTFKKLS